VAELKQEFEVLIKAVFLHKDGDFLVWQLKERLAEFRSKSGLASEPGQKA
jgi:hypothetical protein